MHANRKALTAAFAAACLTAFVAITVKPAVAQDLRAECVRETAGAAVVRIKYSFRTAAGDADESQGSGFLIRSDGYILTAAHVVTPPAIHTSPVSDERVEVAIGSMFGQSYVGSIITKLNDLDVALIKIPALQTAWPVVQIDLLPSPEKRKWLYALGFPTGADLTGTGPGTVTSLNAVIDGRSTQWLNTNVPLTHGMSGGPIFNEFGEVSGLAGAIRSSSGGAISYIVPINLASTLISTAGVADYARNPCAENPRDFVLKFVRNAIEGTYNQTDLSPALWEIIQAQTNGTGKYRFFEDLGLQTRVDVLSQNHIPQGTYFTVKATHNNGTSIWTIAYNKLTKKIDTAAVAPQVDQSPPNPTPVVVGSYSVCVGEKASACFGHEHLACNTDINIWSGNMCKQRHNTVQYEATQTSVRGGNRCGYAVFNVACLKP